LTSSIRTPFKSSYWVVPRELMAGYYPSAPSSAEATGKLAAMEKAGIRHVVNLMEPSERNWDGEPFRPYETAFAARGISCARMPIIDVSIPSVAEMTAILDDIDGSIADGAPVYVHCRGGKGRTGAAVGCWLIRHGLAKPEDAVARIAELQGPARGLLSPSPETEEQRAFVRDWSHGQ
jgi:protein-tyrosine phosphatase